MVWLSGAPVPSEHPDEDLLADLAAEVLSFDVAEQVQNHVIGCGRCAVLLADAEGVRVLLRQSEPEPMPAEVWARLERTLSSGGAVSLDTGSTPATRSGRRARRAAGAEPATSSGAIPTSSIPTSSIPGSSASTAPATSSMPTTSLPLRRGAGTGTGPVSTTGPLPTGPLPTGPLPTGPPPTGPLPTGSMPTSGPPTSRLSRMSRPTTRARRQAIEEARADRDSLLSRLGSLNRVAAVAVGLLVLGGGAFAAHRALGNSSSEVSAASSTGGTAAAKAPLLAAPIEATGTNYSRAELAQQIPALVKGAQKFSAASGAADSPAAPNAAKAAPGPQATRQTDHGSTAHGSAAPDAGAATRAGTAPQAGDLLRSPAALQACLAAIGADQQPVAVDLAQYAGQEAAIIVLPSDSGGYQVEVVARDCRAGNDGTIDVVTVPSS